MSARIGVSIETDVIRAVIVRKQRIVWRYQVEFYDQGSLEETLVKLLKMAPRSRVSGIPAVLIVLGSAYARIKRVDGLPTGSRRDVISAVMKENVTRFFITWGGPVEVSDAEMVGDAWWAAACDARVVQACSTACAQTQFALMGCFPVDHATGETAQGLRQGLGDADGRYASAVAAATATRPLRFIVDPWRRRRDASRRKALKLIASLAIAVSVAAAAVGPALLLEHRARVDRAVAELMTARGSNNRAAATADTQASEALRRISDFKARTPSMTLFIGRLSRELPESTAVISLRVDSLGGSAVALAPVGTSVLSGFVGTHGVGSARLVGSLTRETLAGITMQRSAVAFRLGAPPARVRPPVLAVRRDK